MLLSNSPEQKRLRIRLAIALAIGIVALSATTLYLNNHGMDSGQNRPTTVESSSGDETEKRSELYPVHKNITATVFWVGEEADESNKFIQNRSSAWVEDWQTAYGGVDDPGNRCDYRPCDFTPLENPFYFALPYNDLDENGDMKASVKDVPWYNESSSTDTETILKNRWVKVTRGDKTTYAQWEDVGPFGEEDFDYVFGDNKPSAPEAGIDLSPAAAEYLGVDGRDTVEWRFVKEADVPSGPWREIITRK